MLYFNSIIKVILQGALIFKSPFLLAGILLVVLFPIDAIHAEISPELLEKSKSICNKVTACYEEINTEKTQKELKCDYLKSDCENLLNIIILSLGSNEYIKGADVPVWPGVWEAGIDAAINWGNGKLYFFKKKQYIRFDIASNKVDSGYPKKINSSTWPGLWTDGVDAALNWGNGKAYFFKKNQYIQYDIATDRSDPGYPKEIDVISWPGVWGSGIDAATNWGNGKAYFFKGNEYISFDIDKKKRDSEYPIKFNNTKGFLWSNFLNYTGKNKDEIISKSQLKVEETSPQTAAKVIPDINVDSGIVLFDGSLGEKWKELAAYGGDFKKFARIENKVLVVDVPEGNKKGKTGIRSAEPLIKFPEKGEKSARKLTFSVDPNRSSDYIIAIIPSDWDGNLEWRSHQIRVGVQTIENSKNSSLTLWIRKAEIMKVHLDPESIQQLGIVIRPDRLVLVTDGSDNILLQGFLPENLPIFEEGYRISVLTRAPKPGMTAKLALKEITLEQLPYKSEKVEDDQTIWLDKTQKTVLFDGRILNKRWEKYQLHKGSSFSPHARFVGGALLIDVPEGIGWGKAGIMSSEPLVWLDKFGKGAKVRVNFKFDPDQTTGFVIALASRNASKGNEPSSPRALLYWRKNDNNNTSKVSLFLTPNKKWKPLWEQKLPNRMPEEVSFILTPGGLQVDALGISKDVIPWELAAPSQSFRIYAYSQPEKYKEPVKMALKQIFLERKAGEPIQPSKPQKGVAPLPAVVLFDGKPNEWWEGAGVAGAEFTKFGRFDNNQMIVDVPKKTSHQARAGLLSKKPILDFNERILSTSHKLKIKIDPKQTTGFQIMFHPGKYADMWGNNFKSAISLVRCTKDPCADKYTLLLRVSRNPNLIWSRTIDADWVENKWDGRLTIETGNAWMAVHLSGGSSVRGSGFTIGKNSKLYMTAYSRNYESYGPAKFALEKITSEWVMPDGMSKMDRFLYVDDADFDADAFLDELATEMNAIDDESKTEAEELSLLVFLTQFRLDVLEEPLEAFTKYADTDTAEKLHNLGAVLSPVSDLSDGWKSFFGSSVVGMTSLDEQTVLSMFYNPWADVALLCELSQVGGIHKITQVKLVSGDEIRNTEIPVLLPLWRRTADVPPPLAAVVANSDTMQAFINLYGNPSKWPASQWLNKLPTLKTDNPKEDSRKITGLFFSHNLSSISAFFHDPANSKLKASMEKIRHQLLTGQAEKMLAQTPEMLKESRAVLSSLTPEYWKRSVVVSVAFDSKHTFIFLSSFGAPQMFASFWFDTSDNNNPALRQIDFFRYDLSFEEVDKLARKAGMKRPQPIHNESGGAL